MWSKFLVIVSSKCCDCPERNCSYWRALYDFNIAAFRSLYFSVRVCTVNVSCVREESYWPNFSMIFFLASSYCFVPFVHPSSSPFSRASSRCSAIAPADALAIDSFKSFCALAALYPPSENWYISVTRPTSALAANTYGFAFTALLNNICACVALVSIFVCSRIAFVAVMVACTFSIAAVAIKAALYVP